MNQCEIDELRQKKQKVMAEREKLLSKHQEQQEGQGASKSESLREEIAKLENKILSLQDVRQNLMNKQMAELDLIDFGAQSNLQYLAPGSNFGQQLAELSTNIENMKSDTLNL